MSTDVGSRLPPEGACSTTKGGIDLIPFFLYDNGGEGVHTGKKFF